MEDTIFNIIKENNVIGKGSFGKIYYNPKSFPNYVVKRMKKYNNYGNNFILNNVKELWWYSLISKHDNYDDSELLNIDNINLNNINTDNIPKLLNYHIDSNYIYLLLEYKGISLHNLIKDICINDIDKERYIETIKLIPMIIYTCSKIFLQLHNANMRHGDITISNIMYNKKENDKFKQISIIDWGSFVFSKLTINNYNQCAPEFMAPELDSNSYYNTHLIETPSIKSDIYSLGLVILYILDPSKNIGKYIDQYIKESEMFDDVSNLIDEMIIFIKNKYQNVNIEQYIDERIFYILKKMLDINTNTRIDIESLYMDELFSNYRKQELKFNPHYIKNILRDNKPVHFDEFQNILIEQTYNYLKIFKSKTFKNKNSKNFKLFDTRIILMPTVQLFYKLMEHNKLHKNNQQNTINYYIISYLCCLKWIDIIFNDDISIYHLFELYVDLYPLFSKILNKSIVLDLVNFTTFFDLTFYNIFNIFYKNSNNIVIYPYLMDYKHDYIDYSEIKKMLLDIDHL